MTFPLISEYIESIRMAEDNFATLTNLRPVLDDNGEPIMSSGNFAVVFKMEDITTDEVFAVKCFTKDQEGRDEAYQAIAKEMEKIESPYFVKMQYLEKELFVNSSVSSEEEFPVVVMDWVDGLTLDQYIKNNIDDRYALELLSYCFCQLAYWLVQQPFAHGDLKPDNIIVRHNGMLTLVDYDGMYVPEMFDQKARELGSPNFRHPNRTTSDFDSHIDDLPLVSIALALRMIWFDKKWFEEYSDSEHFIFQASDFANIVRSDVFQKLYDSVSDRVSLGLINLLLLVCKENAIIEKDYEKFVFEAPEIKKHHFINLYCQMSKTNNDEIHALYGKKLCSMSTTERKIRGVSCIFESINKGCSRAKKVLGDCYFCGIGVEKNLNIGIELYSDAANMGNADAQNCLGDCYYYGRGVSKDLKKSVEWYVKAAEQGHVAAQNNLGDSYYLGDGVRKNLQKAFFWYKKSAESMNSDAQRNLAYCYLFGEGIHKDKDKAFECFFKSAEQGDEVSQHCLGVCYERGWGVQKDYRMAVKWYEKSAEQNVADAQYYLALCYEYGKGVRKSLVKAKSLYTKAADQGHEKAIKKLKDLQ